MSKVICAIFCTSNESFSDLKRNENAFHWMNARFYYTYAMVELELIKIFYWPTPHIMFRPFALLLLQLMI